MRTRAEMKQMARKALLGHYGTTSLAVLLMYLILIVAMFAVVIPMALMGAGADGRISGGMLTGVFVFFIIYFLLAVVYMIGYTRMCCQLAAGREARFSDLAYPLKNHLFRFLGLILLLFLFSFLTMVVSMAVFIPAGLLLPAAGGIMGTVFVVKYLAVVILETVLQVLVMCRFTLMLYAMLDDSELTVGQAFRRSGELIRGNYWRMVKLELSFFGMALLGYITAGIGMLWIYPYILTTNAVFYQTLREEKLTPGPMAFL